jgi:hypothetical protein
VSVAGPGGAGGARGERQRCVVAVNEMNGSRPREYVKFIFAECPRSGTRQRFVFYFKILFAEYPGSDTWQSILCQVPTAKHLAKNGFRVLKKSLSSVPRLTLGKECFAECQTWDTRQIILLFFYFPYQIFYGMLLHYIDLHVPF